MLAVNNLSINYGERYLFDDLSFTINPHDRIGLVGSNGAGKSTLLKIIAGINPPMEGSVNKARFITTGYLPQDAVVESDLSLYKEVESAFEDVLMIEQELHEAYEKLAVSDHTSEEYAELLEIIGELQHKQEDADAFRLKSKIEIVLMGLGFSVPDLERQTKTFSGGWQMRIALAKLLLLEPSVLLLDEPTNHLDIESLQWLEEYLQQYNGAIILVSHDRAFLDSLTKKTFALSLGKMEIYSGNYSFYEKERVLRKELILNAKKNQEQQLKQTEEFIERFRYKATKARQVQSRIKQLEKVERIEVEDEEEEIHFHFPQAQSSGRVVMELQNIRKTYPRTNGAGGENIVYDQLQYTIERGDRIAIVGVNGAGKSTISKIAAGIEAFQSGERIVGYNVIVSYFAQHQAEELEMNKEVLQTVDEVAQGEIRTKLRSILGSFLFRGDDVFKKVKVLSGGEKSRLALAKMLLAPANFLIMDEPTNHLDMRSKKVLQEALKEFDGTYLIVSHDRAFLDTIVNKVLEISPGGKIKTYLGNVSEYLEAKKKEKQLSLITGEVNRRHETPLNASAEVHAAHGDTRGKENKGNGNTAPKKNLFQIKKRLEKIEKEIAQLEEEKKKLETAMTKAEFFKHPIKAKTMTSEYDEITKKLNVLMEEWAELEEEHENQR
ncbi:MAG: ABC-F family ATP-binding cassette domain-containing protein [Bacteroidetes bacterium]|nr:ABC-F family ATP-binding cassette domain-containing protein [Bacteroidota bacterium]